MDRPTLKLFAAPMQGYTEAPWRNAHAGIYGNENMPEYSTPFVRIEGGVPRHRDLKDVLSPLNVSHDPTPQVIFGNIGEFQILVDNLRRSGCRRIDMNMGCPFPPQCKKGRGAAVIADLALLSRVADAVSRIPDVAFSLKMRLGLTEPSEWRDAFTVINDMPLRHVTVHPRVASQQYSGELYLDEFADILSVSEHPVVFNGDMRTPEDLSRLTVMFPCVHGVMVGRGLLARPSLFAEYVSGRNWEPGRRLESLRMLHALVVGCYRDSMSGDTQYLSKIKPFWDFLEAETGRKQWKAIRKATSVKRYDEAVEAVFSGIR